MSERRIFLAGRLALVSLSTLVLAAVPARAQDVDRMDQVIRDAADRGEFTGSVLVARDSRVLLDRGYGLANREWQAPNTGDTRFRLASLTKQFTAVAVMLLHERGLVDLDAPVKTYLPDAPASWDRVTVQDLLAHTSGLPDFTRLPDFPTIRMQPATPAALMARIRDLPLDFAPGESWAYSNSGYVVLTAIIEAVGGASYAAFVADNLFAPLGMADSGYDSAATILPRRASGYVATAGGVMNAASGDMSVPQGSGGLYSTTHDLLKWEEGLFGGRLLKPASLERLTTPVREGYAFGLAVTSQDGGPLISHSGAIEGFNTYMARDLAAGTTVIVLGNLNGSAPETIGAALVTLAQGGAVVLADERRALEIPLETLRAYEGVYDLAPTFALTMRVLDGKLMAEATGQKPVELVGERTDAFFLQTVDAQIVFTRDAAGAITGLVLTQGGRNMPARRR